MTYNPDIHHRHSVRLKGFDYASGGAYFVTFNTRNRECILGEIKDGVMYTSDLGEVVHAVWQNLPKHYPNLELDAFVVMPNHVHAIFVLNHVGPGLRPGLENSQVNDSGEGRPTLRVGPTNDFVEKRYPLAKIVGSLKSFSARRINQIRGLTGVPVWQEDYFERIIRNEGELNAIREYVSHNPLGWDKDEENPL